VARELAGGMAALSRRRARSSQQLACGMDIGGPESIVGSAAVWASGEGGRGRAEKVCREVVDGDDVCSLLGGRCWRWTVVCGVACSPGLSAGPKARHGHGWSRQSRPPHPASALSATRLI
jgi:hypothetical protein